MSDKRSRLAARKELLLARASIERMELSAHLGRVKTNFSPSSLFRSVFSSGSLLSGGMGSMLRGRGPTVALNLFQTLRRYPIVTSAASMMLAKVSVRGVFKLVKLGGGALVAYQGYKLWRAIQRDNAANR